MYFSNDTESFFPPCIHFIIQLLYLDSILCSIKTDSNPHFFLALMMLPPRTPQINSQLPIFLSINKFDILGGCEILTVLYGHRCVLLWPKGALNTCKPTPQVFRLCKLSIQSENQAFNWNHIAMTFGPCHLVVVLLHFSALFLLCCLSFFYRFNALGLWSFNICFAPPPLRLNVTTKSRYK